MRYSISLHGLLNVCLARQLALVLGMIMKGESMVVNHLQAPPKVNLENNIYLSLSRVVASVGRAINMKCIY